MALLLCNCLGSMFNRFLLLFPFMQTKLKYLRVYLSFLFFSLVVLEKKSSTYLLTISIHSNFKAFFQSAGLTLVASGDVYGTSVVLLALISEVPSDASLEKSTASIACQHSIVFSWSSVAANLAQDSLLGFCWRIEKDAVIFESEPEF